MKQKQFVFGFYGEGPRDYGFLQPLLERVLANLLPHWEVMASFPISIDRKGLKQPEKILEAARQARKMMLLIIHIDADHRTLEETQLQLFQPGFDQALADEKVCHDLIPVIPVKMTDAWMLVDSDAFRQVVSKRLTSTQLQFPESPAEIERLPDPKAVFERAVQQAQAGRRGRKINWAEVYEPLANKLNLDRLAQVPAYQQFLTSLKKFLDDNHYLE